VNEISNRTCCPLVLGRVRKKEKLERLKIRKRKACLGEGMEHRGQQQ
jgi:hypothetical protein